MTAHDRSGIEADLDVLDESGTVVLIARGLRMGSRASEKSERERVLAERLLTVEWSRNTLTVPDDSVPGNWLLISTSNAEDPLATGLADVLKAHGAQSDLLRWPQHADHLVCVERLTSRLRARGVNGLVVLLPQPVGNADEEGLARGREHVRHLVRIARELPELATEPPRLYVVTRAAQAVGSADQVNLDQAGLAWIAARHRRRAPATAGLPNRRGRQQRPRAGGDGNC